MKKIFEEFRTFIHRGNVLDMATGIIIGSAFTSIVNSLVKDIISPLIGLITGGIDFGNLSITLKKATETTEALTVNYGAFLNAIINFLIVSFVIFNVIKLINAARDRLTKAQKEEEQKKKVEEEAKSAPDIVLLTEIRDLLKK